MVFRNVLPVQVAEVLAVVNAGRYRGNLTGDWQRSGTVPDVGTTRHGPSWRGRIVARNAAGPGAARSASGRRSTAACWHAFRDVFRMLFDLYPDAQVSTVLETYDADTFEQRYPYTQRSGNTRCACEDAETPRPLPDPPTIAGVA